MDLTEAVRERQPVFTVLETDIDAFGGDPVV